MKKLALALLVGSIAACGGGGKPTLIDGSVDAFVTCSPIAQTGCASGEKCTWIIDIDGTATTNEIGHIGCVANGNLPEGMACNDATAAANGGADTCVAGQLCISRKCKPICDPQLVDGSAAGACKVNFSCSIYAGVFESGGAATAGVCEPGCDPLSQQLAVSKAEACGSIDPTKPSGSCVPSRGFLSFHCAPSGSIVYDKTDRVAPLADPASGNPFGNGCAPGFIPFYFEQSGSMNTVCTGLCAPLKTDSEIVKTAGHEMDNQGNTAALAKLVADPAPVAGHAVCKPNIKGAAGLLAPHGEDCRFVWLDLAGRDTTMIGNSPFNNTLGFCFAYEKFQFTDPGPPQMTFVEKSCAELPVTAPDKDPFGAAVDNGCYPLPATVAATGAASARAKSRWASTHRLANPDAILVRHVFD